jgi:hypothetical protein
MAQANKKQPEKSPKELLDKPIKKDKAPSLSMPRFGLADEARNVWRAIVPSETEAEQVLDESFWANVSRLLQPGDEIQVLPDDYAWRRDLHVVSTGNNWAQVVTLNHYELAPSKPAEGLPSRYKVQFAGAHHKWRVLRDGEPLKDGFASEKIARQWAANHEAAVNR